MDAMLLQAAEWVANKQEVYAMITRAGETKRVRACALTWTSDGATVWVMDRATSDLLCTPRACVRFVKVGEVVG